MMKTESSKIQTLPPNTMNSMENEKDLRSKADLLQVMS
jgi:hypothetical protein